MVWNGPSRSRKIWRRGFLLLVFATILLTLFNSSDNISLLKKVLYRISELGPWAPFAFVVAYVVATILMMPGFILTLGAGFLYGVGWGSALVSASSTMGAMVSFLIGRYLFRDWVTKKMKLHPSFISLDRAVVRDGWKVVGLTRLSPIFPFNFLNYAFAVTQIRVRHYFIASWIGMFPGTLLYAYIGSLAGDIASIGTGGKIRSTWEWAFYLLGFVAITALCFYLNRIGRKSLEKKVD